MPNNIPTDKDSSAPIVVNVHVNAGHGASQVNGSDAAQSNPEGKQSVSLGEKPGTPAKIASTVQTVSQSSGDAAKQIALTTPKAAANSAEAQKFPIKLIKAKWDKERKNVILDEENEHLLESLHELMSRNFRASEIDTPEVTAEAIADETLLVHVAEDADHNVIAFTSGTVLPLLLPSGDPDPKRAFVGLWYVANEVPGEVVQDLGKALEVDAKKKAEKDGREIIGALTEAMYQEKFFENRGLKRMYIKVGDTYKELPYFQPPVAFFGDGTGKKWSEEDEARSQKEKVDPDSVTWMAVEHNEVPEHLMFGSLDGKATELSKDDVLAMVDAMFDYNSLQNPPDEEEALEGHEAQMQEIVGQYRSELTAAIDESTDPDKKIYLLDRGTRAKMKKDSGTTFVDHRIEVDADEKEEMDEIRNLRREQRRMQQKADQSVERAMVGQQFIA